MFEIIFKGAGANRLDREPPTCFVIIVFSYRVLQALAQGSFLFRSQIVEVFISCHIAVKDSS